MVIYEPTENISYLERTDIMVKLAPKIIIIGGVSAGPAAAARAARMNPEAAIVLYEKDRYVSYRPCNMPYFISGVIRNYEELIVFTPDRLQREKRVQVKIGRQVENIRPVQRRILVRDLASNSIYEDPYDRLILATGSKARQPFSQMTGCPNFFTLKTLSDALRLKDYIRSHRPQKAVILGASLVALEMVEALLQAGLQIVVLHRSDLPAPNFEETGRRLILEKMKEKNIAYHGNIRVSGFSRDSATGLVSSVETEQGLFSADVVLLAWGFEPNVDLAKTAGIRLGSTGGIIVDEQMRTSHDSIYACGDCIELKQQLTGRPVYLPLATHAIKTGRIAADNAAGMRAVYKGTVGTIGFQFFDLEAARTGLSTESASDAGFRPVSQTIRERSRSELMPAAEKMSVTLIADSRSGRLLGANIIGKAGAGLRIDLIAIALQQKMTVHDLGQADFLYSPRLAPLWDPVIVCANVLQKQLETGSK